MSSTTSSSSAPAPPAPRPRCCSPVAATTCSSSTAPSCRSDTLSTHAIARSGVVQLDRWGLLDRVARIRRAGDPRGRLPRRRHLHGQIRSSTTPASTSSWRRGATCSTPSSPTQRRGRGDAAHRRARRGTSRADDGRVTGVWGHDADGPVELRARLVIGADGVRSRIARSVAADTVDARPSVGATHYAYHAAPTWTSTELYVGRQALSGIFPTHDGQACIWTCLPRDEAVAFRHDAADPAAAFDAMLRRAAARARRAGRRDDAGSRPCAARWVCPTTCCAPVGPGGRWSATPATTAIRSPATGSATRCATPTCSPTPCTTSCAASTTRPTRPRRLPADPRPHAAGDLRDRLRPRPVPGRSTASSSCSGR